VTSAYLREKSEDVERRGEYSATHYFSLAFNAANFRFTVLPFDLWNALAINFIV